MVAKEIDGKATIRAKLGGLCLSYILFLIIYNFCGWYASNLEHVGSFVFRFENNIPFLAWMIVPYMSSGLFFALIFFMCSGQKELLLLTKRINFVTIVSGLFFIILPLKFTFTKPEIDSPILRFFFQFLNTWDTNYNQAPSLHISYACIFWSVLRKELYGKWKTIAAVWLLLMGISTLTVYQHHLIDIIAALLLICITLLLFPERKDRNYYIGIIYLITSILFAVTALLIYQYISGYGLILLWLSITLLLVGVAYVTSNHRFLKREDGTINILKKVIYLPYTAIYKAFRLFFCKNEKHPVTEIYPRVFLGPILNRKQADKFNINDKTIVIDLSAELEENKAIRQKATYYSFPILDIGVAEKEYIDSILKTLSVLYTNMDSDQKIYIHCLMGYSRSVFITTIFIRDLLNIDTPEAIDMVRKNYPYAIFPQYLLDLTIKK
ncbi:protein-tyrosine phosphatase/membrane-associated phospholipid phosphatase [Dysgonomonas sp. PFB1-18]|uniref:dual specificity protein phosphatase family protein n=1 Tax=unclassified Dysgonomonas TaxID=2630389 RepID=UPI00247635EB|nr:MULTISPECIES: dual specificity protein phosphatase family protein [unclassified Dysgonomonas]MDH6310519.1 protein-tyrosine phosphatase/membrane-associated phospholipid phosphatase [Dysgonomonas sp. PF1-14]MDH6340369.1 protein-tyrosine phosphatase/membrane-associated phospholipid phosphatase [Dysgonomonas sp. PF1-16]MDH6382051.1 protein-tyrosine phosphatase/membrane-associated phospholipid phosphatase [Dysgonomonas sp. PFB1-18]MDH6399340.1 protein-tyrosine phosphatase/membrane-associated phos